MTKVCGSGDIAGEQIARCRAFYELQDLFFKLTIQPCGQFATNNDFAECITGFLFGAVLGLTLVTDSNPNSPASLILQPRGGCSDGVSLFGFLDKRLEELSLADRAIVILVHGLEILLEGRLVELSVGLHAKEHSAAELANLVLFELTVSVAVDIGE